MDTEQGLHLLTNVKENGSGRITINYDNLTIPVLLTCTERRQLIAMLYYDKDDAISQQEIYDAMTEMHEEQKKQDKETKRFKLVPIKKGIDVE